MTEYYIKISDHIPLEDDESLWFKINADEVNDTDEILVLRRNKYEELKSLLEAASENLQNNEMIQEAVDSLVADYNVTANLSVNSQHLVSLSDDSLKWDYDTIANVKSDISGLEHSKLDKSEYVIDSEINDSSANPVENRTIKEALDGKADNSIVESIGSILITKSDNGHVHNEWTWRRLNDYAVIYYNDNLRLCDFRYYREEYNFTKTDSFNLHTGLIPQAYRPKFDIVLPFYHYHILGYISADGNFVIRSDVKSKYAINTRVIWHY